MAKLVPVHESRVRTERTPDGLRIDVVRRRPWLLYVMPGWAAVIVGLGAASMLFGDGPAEPAPVAFLAIWFAVGLSIVGISLWSLLHREQLLLDARALTQTRRLGPLRRRRSFARERIDDLRVSPETMSPFDPRAGLRVWGVGAGAIAFDYGDRSYRVADVEEAEAKRVVAVLAGEGLAQRRASEARVLRD